MIYIFIHKITVLCLIYILPWEPSVVKVTKSYSRRLPALERKPLEFPNQNLSQIGSGVSELWSDKPM